MTKAAYDKYAWGTPEDAALHTGESYERYIVPSIGMPSARPVLQAADLREGERVLDVGCGTGIAARLAAKQVGASGSVVGVDPTPPMLEVARRTAADIEWHEATAEALPLADESIDAVVCSLSFQFFADRPKALHEMRRVVVPGGRAVIGTPGPTPPLMAAIADVLSEHIGPDASKFVHGVFSFYDPDEIHVMLDAAGFADIEVEAGPLPLRVPPPADFLWQYVHSTPLAPIATQLDDDTRTALEHDVVEQCRPFLDGGALVMEPALLVACGRRS